MYIYYRFIITLLIIVQLVELRTVDYFLSSPPPQNQVSSHFPFIIYGRKRKTTLFYVIIIIKSSHSLKLKFLNGQKHAKFTQ